MVETSERQVVAGWKGPQLQTLGATESIFALPLGEEGFVKLLNPKDFYEFIEILGLTEVDSEWCFMGLVVAQERLRLGSSTTAFQPLYSRQGFNHSVNPCRQLPSGNACPHLQAQYWGGRDSRIPGLIRCQTSLFRDL